MVQGKKMWAVSEGGGVVMVHFSEPKWRGIEGTESGYYESSGELDLTTREFAKMMGLKLNKKDAVYQLDIKASAKEVTVKRPKPSGKGVKKGK